MNQQGLKLLASQNQRGIPTNRIVYEILDTRAKLKLLEISPDDAIGFQCPSYYTEKEWVEEHRYFWDCVLESCFNEIERRRNINEDAIKKPAREIIQAIKTDMPLADVLEWYTKVIYNGRKQWKFHCTLHGEDKHPSGIIYSDEQRWWCFTCNQGGDVFDAVQAFERVDLPQAIKKLATYLGIELRPLTNKKKRMGIDI